MNDLESRYKQASFELKELNEWRYNEDMKIIDRLSSEGKPLGLDGYTEEFAPIRREYYRRVLELYDKYNLPNKPNFDKWLS